MLLATSTSDYDSNDPASVYLAQLYAAQQRAAASLNAMASFFYPSSVLYVLNSRELINMATRRLHRLLRRLVRTLVPISLFRQMESLNLKRI